MIAVRKAGERGRTRTDWLDSRHTFSFADYADPRQMGFGPLRVINEDVVDPARGFGRHPHRDMEIISYVIEGAIEHADSMGNGSVIRPGDVQRMTAGTGVLHSERNPSSSERVHFLQIWIVPERSGLAPGYEQKTFGPEQVRNVLRLIASPDGADGSVTVHQNAKIYASVLDTGKEVTLPLGRGRRAWAQIVKGGVTINGQTLAAGDGAAIEREDQLKITGTLKDSELIVFDLP